MSNRGYAGHTEALIHQALDEHKVLGTHPTPHRIEADTPAEHRPQAIIARVTQERATQPHHPSPLPPPPPGPGITL